MKPPVPLPNEQPFITFYTPTFRRPQRLARLLESVARQTARARVEHLVIPDHVGYGIIDGLYGRLPWYAAACRGSYVTIVGDDDMLVSETAVAELEAFAKKRDFPEVIIVPVVKNGLRLPARFVLPPECGDIDLCNYILRRDIWVRHAGDYGKRYEGDFDHGMVLFNAGYRHEYCDLQPMWIDGDASHGRPEVDWP